MFLCTAVSSAGAQDGNYIINEDFEEFENNSSTYQREQNGWTYYGYRNQNIGYLKIDTYLNPNAQYERLDGYVQSPVFNYTGDALLMFSYIKPSKQETSLTVSIEGGGYFDNDNNNADYKSFNIKIALTLTAHNYYSKTIKIIGATENTTIKFSINNLTPAAIDDVKVIKLGQITLDERYDPSEAITANVSRAVTVQTRRTLKGDIWNTMCLPFHVTTTSLEAALEAALGSDADIELRTYSSYDATTSTMNFAAPASDEAIVTAGTPFLIKVSKNIENPTFNNVTLSQTAAQTITYSDVSFVGTYGPKALATDGTNLFITNTNALAKPSAKNTINGLRAYIVVPKYFNTYNARIALNDGDATAVTTAKTSEIQTHARYNLMGQRVAPSAKGLTIINGKLTLSKTAK